MNKTVQSIGGHECLIYDCGSSDTLLIQPVDDHDIEVLDSEVAEVIRLTGGTGFTLAAFRVHDWNADLSPWEAPPVFGSEGFAGGAEKTLSYVIDELIPALTGAGPPPCTARPRTAPTASASRTACCATIWSPPGAATGTCRMPLA